MKLLLQYDLQALNIVFAGQLGLPDPDPRPVAKVETPAPAPAPKKPALVNVAWTAEFGYNRRLSEKRAEAVRAYLVSKGVDPDKIEVFGYGKTLPVKSCADQKKRSALIECLAPNRRIVVEVQATP